MSRGRGSATPRGDSITSRTASAEDLAAVGGDKLRAQASGGGHAARANRLAARATALAGSVPATKGYHAVREWSLDHNLTPRTRTYSGLNSRGVSPELG